MRNIHDEGYTVERHKLRELAKMRSFFGEIQIFNKNSRESVLENYLCQIAASGASAQKKFISLNATERGDGI